MREVDADEEQLLHDVGTRWMAAMRRGDFEAAWRQTDRIELPRRAAEAAGRLDRGPQHLTWNGAPFDGRDVLVRCEHGLGDTLQFIRYVPLLRARARRVTVLVQPALLPLFDASDRFGQVRNGWTTEPPPPHDLEIEVMELPYAFRSTAQSLPRNVPYLPLDPVRRRGDALPALPKGDALRVGLLWSASEWDTSRSIPLEALAPLARVPHVQFYSLQQGDHAEPASAAPFPIEPYSRYTTEITAAAAAMLELDLVITADAMAAHLAGALARPVWVLLKHDADWRWMTGRSDSPWYPTMRLLRQPQPGDWSALAQALADALGAFRGERSL
jgi:hypothetical protein